MSFSTLPSDYVPYPLSIIGFGFRNLVVNRDWIQILAFLDPQFVLFAFFQQSASLSLLPSSRISS